MFKRMLTRLKALLGMNPVETLTARKMTTKLRANNAHKLATLTGNTISGVAVITCGVAAGHDLTIDEVMCQQVMTMGNAQPNGLPVYWTHGTPDKDRLGDYLGYLKNFSFDGQSVRADFTLSDIADKLQPLKSYVLGLAKENIEELGLSIEFTRDAIAELEYAANNPTEEQPHARVLELHGCAVVAEPAANAALLHSETIPHDYPTEKDNASQDELKMKIEAYEALTSDPALILKWAKASATIDACKAELAEIATKAKDAELATLKENLSKANAEIVQLKATPKPEGVAPVAFSGDKSGPQDFIQLSRELSKAKNIPMVNAMKEIARTHPGIEAAYRAGKH
jgi:hypothetical protein